MAITGTMMNKSFFVLLLTCMCFICSPFYGGVTPIAGSNVSNKPNFLYRSVFICLTCSFIQRNGLDFAEGVGVSRNSSALPEVGSAEGGWEYV